MRRRVDVIFHGKSLQLRASPTEGDKSKMTEIYKKHARETLSKVKRTVSRAREPRGYLETETQKGNDASRGELRREAAPKKKKPNANRQRKRKRVFLSISVILDLSPSVGRTRGCLEL